MRAKEKWRTPDLGFSTGWLRWRRLGQAQVYEGEIKSSILNTLLSRRSDLENKIDTQNLCWKHLSEDLSRAGILKPQGRIRSLRERVQAKGKNTQRPSLTGIHCSPSSQSLLWIISIVCLGSKICQMHNSRHFCHIKLFTVQQMHYVVSDVKTFTHSLPWPKIQSRHLHSSVTNHPEIPTHASRTNLVDPSLMLPSLCCPCDGFSSSHYLFSVSPK